MILCRECGNSAPSKDGFCSSCGALLDWSGERVETAVLPTVSANPTGGEVWSPGPAEAGGGAGTGAGAAAQTVAHGQAVQPVAHGPVIPPDPTARQTELRPPGRHPTAEARRADPVPIASEPEYSGPYCQACGVRNPEGRQFCRSCGAPLSPTGQAPGPRRGWWRRLLDRILRRRPQYSAGERPSGFRDHSEGAGANPHGRRLKLPRHIKLGKLAPVVLVLGLVGIGLGPARSWVTTEVSSLLGRAKAKVDQHYANVTPTGAAANAEKGHPAGLAIDGVNTTYWASAQHTDGVGDVITITFAGPVDIDQIGLLSGADPANFRLSARPHDLVVAAPGSPDATLSFDDTADFQSRALTLRHVSSVTITVKDAYPGQKQHDLAVRDLEFFVKSS
jgi:hypothetical protein